MNTFRALNLPLPIDPILWQVREDLLSIYVASRLLILTYFILYAAFSVARDDGWGYQLYLIAWVLSLFAQFKSFVSVFWLAVTTGVFLQGIGVSFSVSLRFVVWFVQHFCFFSSCFCSWPSRERKGRRRELLFFIFYSPTPVRISRGSTSRSGFTREKYSIA